MSQDLRVEYQTHPSQYRHWKLSFNGPVATLSADFDENGGLRPGYKLKLNSYDLGVDIELNDAINYWLGDVEPTTLGLRTFNKIKNRIVKVQESEHSSTKAQAKAAKNIIAVIAESQKAAGSRNPWTEDF